MTDEIERNFTDLPPLLDEIPEIEPADIEIDTSDDEIEVPHGSIRLRKGSLAAYKTMRIPLEVYDAVYVLSKKHDRSFLSETIWLIRLGIIVYNMAKKSEKLHRSFDDFFIEAWTASAESERE